MTKALKNKILLDIKKARHLLHTAMVCLAEDGDPMGDVTQVATFARVEVTHRVVEGLLQDVRGIIDTLPSNSETKEDTMNADFNFRANNRFVVTCNNHAEVDRCASKVAAQVRADQLAGEKPHCPHADCCNTKNGCKFTVSEGI